MLNCVQDPGNLEADLQAGGFAGYALLWLFLVCTIMVRDVVEDFKAVTLQPMLDQKHSARMLMSRY